MKWLMRHATDGTRVNATFDSVMELYRGTPLIRSVRRLELTGEGVEEAGARCLEIVLDGRRDILFYSTDASRTFQAPGGFEFAGRLGLYREGPDGKALTASLVGGTRLLRHGIGLTLPAPGGRARIEAVDRGAGTVTVAVPASELEPFVGRIVHVTNPVRRVSLHVTAVRGDGRSATLTLELDPCVGIGQSAGAADGRVLTGTRFPLRGFRYYHGARIATADGSAEFPVKGVHSGGFVLVGAEGAGAVPQAELEKAFPAGSWFSLYDYGVGDALEWTHVATLALTGQ